MWHLDFDQCYNGQTAVNDDMVIVGAYSNAHVNDKQEFIASIESIPEELSEGISTAVADAGYFSKTNVNDCEKKQISPLISPSKERHTTFLSDALTGHSQEGTGSPGPLDKMKQRLKNDKGKAIYKKRKQTVEPVLGVIKEILGFRRFSLRGETETDAEWKLVCLAYNLKRFFKLQAVTV